MGALGDKFNTMAGGGQASEANEDYLDKAIDMYREKVLGQGPQNNESAVEQAKDEALSEQFEAPTSKPRDPSSSSPTKSIRCLVPVQAQLVRFMTHAAVLRSQHIVSGIEAFTFIIITLSCFPTERLEIA